jgi:basic membrane protein A
MNPQKIGRYEVKAELGRGGMAIVYHAYDPHFERDVAVKVLPHEFLFEPTFRARFEREARTIAALEHPAIVPVHDFGEDEGRLFLVMRYMAGGTLADRIRQGPLPLDETARIYERLAPALDEAHAAGIIHRDVKPSNILFDHRDDAHLSDFGIVKVAEMTAQLTGSGIVGTPAYMAPEMADPHELTGLVDIYALGVTLFQTLTGEQPYQAPTPMGVMMAHVSKPIPDARRLRPDLPDAVQAVVARAMAKDPMDRYPTAGEMAADLQAVSSGELAAAPPTRAEAPRREEASSPTTSDARTVGMGEESAPEEDVYATVRAAASDAPVATARPEPEAAIPAPPAAPPGRRSMPSWVWIGGGLIVLAICVAAIVGGLRVTGMLGGGATEEPTGEAPAEEAPAEEAPAEEVTFTVGMVTDMGGVDDQSFNQTGWEGLQQAGEELGINVSFLESQMPSDYQPNIQQYLDQDADLIITVGYLLAEDTQIAAEVNPDTMFAIIDEASSAPNVMGIQFSVDEAAFGAGYLAAGMTQTGIVGTYGGVPIPSVVMFMVGFEQGVNYYNEVHGTDVQVLGWNTETGEGLFTFDFESTENGRRMAEDLISQGADIILPVAGPVGLGTVAVAEESPGTMVIWVDRDGCVAVPDSCGVFLTTVVKNAAVTVYGAVEATYNGEFAGGSSYMGTLANGGVSLAPYHEYEDDVPADLAAEVDDVLAGIAAGEINTGWADFLASGLLGG